MAEFETHLSTRTMAEDTELLGRLQGALAHRYRIVRELGRGGTATVYLAEEPRHSRYIALKVLHPRLAATLGSQRFLREIKTTANLSHPHILPLFDSGEADGLLFYVMPYLDGESLRHRLKRERQLSLDDALTITAEVADALGFAHAHGVIHRDVKPENILVEAGHAVVSDFGIAKAILEAGGEALTNTGLAVGTPQYMSPEQAAGTSDLDARSDIYSLGCVAYEMLAGDPPFANTIPQAILARKAVESPSPLRYIRDTLPPHVEQAIARALARVPADRFRSMQQFSDALLHPGGFSKRAKPSGTDATRIDGPEPVPPLVLKPLLDELDAFGLSHPGNVQKVNQDHFLICSVARDMAVHQTTLPNSTRLPRRGERQLWMAIVADGTGRGGWGEEASRSTIEVLAQYMVHSMRSYHADSEAEERRYMKGLREALQQSQAYVAQQARETPSARGMGSSLIAWMGHWPRAYVLQVGQCHCFLLRGSELTRLSKEYSSGEDANDPLVYKADEVWGDVGLLCTDGLTRHVSEERIHERLSRMVSARQLCEDLLEDALAGGGTENITLVIARARLSS
jgi:serine/threonine protein kinase